MIALTFFGWDLSSEPHFVDESAYISQSSYADLFITGDRNNPLWLTYAGYDLPPLPKYLIGLSLRLEGLARPPSSTIWQWYANTSRRFVSKEGLTIARRPSVILGIVGVLAIYALGTMAGDRWVGMMAGVLLIANPLYRMHARRAMSDVPAEALILLTTAVGLWGWKRLMVGRVVVPSLVIGLGSGILGGLATLAKLNGALGGFVLGAWAGLGFWLTSFPFRGRVMMGGATIVAGCVSFATFVALNPFLYAHPRSPIDPRVEPIARLWFVERVELVARHRTDVSSQAKSLFPDDALSTPLEKMKAVAVQGFGRFGPLGPRSRFDSTIRHDWEQDRGALIWLPWVALGLVAAVVRGRAQLQAGQPPTAWAVAIQALVALVVVTSFIPLAWDRYFLSLQPGSALLGAIGLVEGWDRLRGFVRSRWS